MKIVVNGKPVDVAGPSPTVADVLSTLGFRAAFAAVAVNFECVPRRELASRTVAENDEIEILEPQQGG